MKEKMKMYLSDDRVRETTEYVPWAENDTIDGFFCESEVVISAAGQCSEQRSGAVQAAFILRAFYLLGVQRGAEDWRKAIADEIGAEHTDNLFEPMGFVLDEGCSADVVDDFRLYREEIEGILARLGLRF